MRVWYGVASDQDVYFKYMPKRSSKKPPADPNRAASRVVQAIADDDLPKKNPAAVSLGRLGGKKGGKARAEALSPEQRREIAKAGASARWSKQNPDGK